MIRRLRIRFRALFVFAHVLKCKHCRTLLNNLELRTAMMFQCQRGRLVVRRMLRAAGQATPSYPDFIERA